MRVQPSNSLLIHSGAKAIVVDKANTGALFLSPREEMEKMARRRFQDPKPERSGNWWYLRFWRDDFVNGASIRTRQRVKLAPASMPEREVKKIAAEMLRPINQGLVTVGSAVNFKSFVETTYNPTVLPLLAKSTRDCYSGLLKKYLIPAFGGSCLRDMNPLTLQRYFSGLPAANVSSMSAIKIRDSLSSVLRSAVRFGFLVKDPLDGLQLPPDRKGKRAKPVITPEQFRNMLEVMPEPYATMVFVSMWTGLRVSELIGLKWHCIHADSISVEERYFRGDWSVPKTKASAATIAVDSAVIERIQRLKTLSVNVRAGRAVRTFQVVKSDGPDDLVFQSIQDGKPMRDNNVLKRFIKPAAKKFGLAFVNWRCLRTSHATWLIQAGADVKSAQGQMRHSRASTLLDIYSQIIPDSQRRALEKLSSFAKEPVPNAVPLLVQ